MKLYQFENRIFIEIFRGYLVYLCTEEEKDAMSDEQFFDLIVEQTAHYLGAAAGHSKGVH